MTGLQIIGGRAIKVVRLWPSVNPRTISDDDEKENDNIDDALEAMYVISKENERGSICPSILANAIHNFSAK